MKRFFLISTILISVLTTYGQDLIVFTNGDSLNCAIFKVETNYVYFSYFDSAEIKQTLSSIDKIRDYRRKYYEQSLFPKELSQFKTYDRFRLTFDYGYSYRTAKISSRIPSRFKEYSEELKSGTNWGSDAVVYLSDYFGIGFSYNSFRSKNSIDNVQISNENGELIEGHMSDDISINTLGMIFSSRFYTHQRKNAFFLNGTIGWTKYRNEAIVIEPLLIEGGNISTTVDMGYDFGITKELSIGIQVSYLGAFLNEYTLSNPDGSNSRKIELEAEEFESLNRIDLNIGLRLNL